MSRIGKQPIPVPAGVKIDLKGQHIKVTGSKGTLNRDIIDDIEVVDDGQETYGQQEEPGEQEPARFKDIGLDNDKDNQAAPHHGMQIDRIAVPDESDTVNAIFIPHHASENVGEYVFVQEPPQRHEGPDNDLQWQQHEIKDGT